MAVPRFPYNDLPEFLAALEAAGELHRVKAEVDPTLEISEIVTRTVRAKGPALLFERPTRGEMPVAINLFGTHRRMAMALGVSDVDEIGARIGELVKPELPVGLAGLREALGKVMQLKSVPPKRVKSAPCQEVVYRGDQVGDGRKSVALHLSFQSPERTLTDDEAAELRGAIVSALADRFDAELRA